MGSKMRFLILLGALLVLVAEVVFSWEDYQGKRGKHGFDIWDFYQGKRGKHGFLQGKRGKHGFDILKYLQGKRGKHGFLQGKRGKHGFFAVNGMDEDYQGCTTHADCGPVEMCCMHEQCVPRCV